MIFASIICYCNFDCYCNLRVNSKILFEIMSLDSKILFLLKSVRFLYSHLTTDTMEVMVGVNSLFAIRTMEDVCF